MQFLTFAQVVLRRWWLLPILAALGLAGAYAWSSTAPRRYESTVSLQLNPAARSSLLPFGGDLRGEPGDFTVLAASYAEVLRSRSFGQIVAQQLNLPYSPEA